MGEINHEAKVCLSVTDLAKELGVSRTTAYSLIHREDFPAARVGKRVLVVRDALERWLAAGGTRNDETNI